MRAQLLLANGHRCAAQFMLRAFLIALVALVMVPPATREASGAQLVTWDTLAPNAEITETDSRRSPENGDVDRVDHSQTGSSAGSGFDLSNSGASATETWDQQSRSVSSTVVNEQVVIDGYVLPLAWDGIRVVEFLLVPWIGACIHMPAPPPNQIVHVSYPQGLMLEKQFDAVRLAGKLEHVPAEHDLFLVDGQRRIAVSYALSGAETAGAPGKVIAMSANDLPKMAQLQIWINSLFTESMQAVGENGSMKALFFAVLIAFGYGALHTLGPGHGKSVVISYFVGTGGSLSRGLSMGVRIAICHVLSAVVVVFLLDFAVRQATGSAPSDYRAIRLASYALIIVIGVVMMWRAISAIVARRNVLALQAARHASNRSNDDSYHEPSHDHVHNHSHHARVGCSACAAAAQEKGSGWIALSVGLVPCTGALLVMLFGLANDLVWPAVLMVVAISVGMAVAMSAIGVAAIWGRKVAEKRFGGESNKVLSFDMGARLAGSASVLAIGTLLFVLALSYPPVLSPPINEIALQKTGQEQPEG